MNLLNPNYMPVGYVIGPYRSSTIRGVVENINKAEELSLIGWSLGAAMITPHKNSALLDGALAIEDSIWLAGYISILSRCDFAITVEGWEKSDGSVKEVLFCDENMIEVFHSEEPDWKEKLFEYLSQT